MAKRITDRNLTDTIWDQEDEGEEKGGAYPIASKGVLRSREFKKAVRRNAGGDAEFPRAPRGFAGFPTATSTTTTTSACAGAAAPAFFGFGSGTNSFSGVSSLTHHANSFSPSFGGFPSPGVTANTTTPALALSGAGSTKPAADVTFKQNDGSSLTRISNNSSAAGFAGIPTTTSTTTPASAASGAAAPAFFTSGSTNSFSGVSGLTHQANSFTPLFGGISSPAETANATNPALALSGVAATSSKPTADVTSKQTDGSFLWRPSAVAADATALALSDAGSTKPTTDVMSMQTDGFSLSFGAFSSPAITANATAPGLALSDPSSTTPTADVTSKQNDGSGLTRISNNSGISCNSSSNSTGSSSITSNSIFNNTSIPSSNRINNIFNSTSISPSSSSITSSVINDYNQDLAALNRSVRDWIAKHVDANPLIDLSPVFRDYERHLANVDNKYSGVVGVEEAAAEEAAAVTAGSATALEGFADPSLQASGEKLWELSPMTSTATSLTSPSSCDGTWSFSFGNGNDLGHSSLEKSGAAPPSSPKLSSFGLQINFGNGKDVARSSMEEQHSLSLEKSSADPPSSPAVPLGSFGQKVDTLDKSGAAPPSGPKLPPSSLNLLNSKQLYFGNGKDLGRLSIEEQYRLSLEKGGAAPPSSPAVLPLSSFGQKVDTSAVGSAGTHLPATAPTPSLSFSSSIHTEPNKDELSSGSTLFAFNQTKDAFSSGTTPVSFDKNRDTEPNKDELSSGSTLFAFNQTKDAFSSGTTPVSFDKNRDTFSSSSIPFSYGKDNKHATFGSSLSGPFGQTSVFRAPQAFSTESAALSASGWAGGVGAETVRPTHENGADAESDEPPNPEVTEVKETDAFYSKRCKLFYKKETEYKEKGVGTLHLKAMPGGKTQLIVRADTNLGNILLNIVLQASVPCSRVGKNNVLVVCVPNPSVDGQNPSGPLSLLIRVKTSEEADELHKLLEEKKVL